jgi:site-specific DNA-methyltransferase (adenine-specific)
MQIKDLKQDRRNYRKHNQRNLDLIKKSVSEVGLGRSVVIDNENEIVCGNGLVSTLDKDTPIKVIETDGSELVVVKRTDLATNDDKRKQLAIMDNSTSESSEWDFEKLEADFDTEELEDWGLDVDFAIEEEEKEVVEDEVPEEVETRCKLGDIWQLGEHRLMCGDSTKVDDVEKLMNGEKADMVFTDPPYGMGLNTDWSGAKSNQKFYKEKGCQGTGNKYEQGLVDEFTPEIISNLFACLGYVKEMFLFGADYYAELLPNKNDGSWIVWDKRSNDGTNEEYISQSDKMFGSCFELCWSKNKHRREIARVKWAGIFGTEKEFDKKRCHPTQKPSALVQWFLDRYSKDNELIVDLFGGSGSTLIACEQLNRKCFMMELDEHYCDVIITRWENLTGKKAVLCS